MSVGFVSWCQRGTGGAFALLTDLSPKAVKWIRGRLLHSGKLHHGWSLQIFHVGLIANCFLSLASKCLVSFLDLTQFLIAKLQKNESKCCEKKM